MVATRSLNAGDIILREKAAVVGPSMDQSKAICLASAASLARTWHLCSLCQCVRRPFAASSVRRTSRSASRN